ncbi:site-specific DNA-methyltransferase (cytosine-N4-specific) [Salana multivorans]|uniref:Methyltransferase n=1 Tax=Salana multivorans TaxID=120377 RepID=A0A3N2DDE4_9MICO|nr:site-specific DNA-methyltransferase [Salana multivorans]ROR97815.1 site-specific DNA-methyltransferase (cytosine-N4-specific) [Salana multivorans]
MTPYYSDPGVTLWHGDALGVLRGLDAGSVDCIVTSPPYYKLRDYGVEGQLGAEESPAEYVEALVAALREARRVLADDGTLWLNLGDSYYSGKGSPTSPDLKNEARRPPARALDRPGQPWGQRKGMLGIPWRVALALQDDGWVLRNDIIWAKPNAMPESVTDRLSTRHEHVFLLTKSPRYFFDLDAIREPVTSTRDGALTWDRDEQGVPGQKPQHRPGRTWSERSASGAPPRRGLNPGHAQGDSDFATPSRGRNPGDVWTIATQPFPGAHFATMPPALAERCILAGCKPGGTVLDPFSGSGTTGLAAAKHGHPYVGIDLNADYLDMSLRTRLAQPGLDLEGLTA